MHAANNYKAEFLVGDVVLLGAGELQLLVYQSEIERNDFLQNKLVAYQQDFLTDEINALKHNFMEQPQSYIAIDAKLEPRQQAAQRFLLTKFFGCNWLWLWDDVKIMLDVKLAIQELPNRALADDSPLLGVVNLAGQLAFVSNTQLLENYILSKLRAKHV